MLKRRFLICLALLVALLVANFVMIQAAGSGDLTFTPNDAGDGYIVTDCASTASGSLSVPSTYSGKPVVGIGREAFLDCTGLTSVTIPSSVKTIGWYAFSGCTGLTSVNIPDSVTTIDWFAFSDCTGLTSVTVGDGVTCIDASAFAGCTKLTSVTLGKSVTSIGWSAFKGCTKLSSINIPGGVNLIDRYAFYNCSSLSSVTYCGTSQEWSAITKAEGNDALSGVTVTYHKYTNCICSLCQDSQHSPADAVKENEKAATCAAAGSYDSVVYCSSCKAEISRNTIPVPATSHTEVIDEAIAPTCTESGLTEGKHCSVCNEVLVARTIVDALGHTEEAVPGKAATCTETGLTDGVVCSVCGTTVTEQTTIPATGHTFVDGICACGATEAVERLDIRGVSRAKSLALEGTILVYATVAYVNTDGVNVEGLSKDYIMENGGLLFWALEDMPANPEDAVIGTETSATKFIVSSTYKDGVNEYSAYSHGIAAKEYNDSIYYRTYIEVDGEVYYGDIIEYSVVTYCENQIKKTTANAIKMKPLLAAMLNYGAAAQVKFGYKPDALANACLQTYVDQGLLDAAHLTLNWNDSYLTALTEADAAMTVNFAENDAARTSKSLALEGAVETKLTFAYKLNGDKGTKMPEDGSIAFYYWTAKTYESLKAAGQPLTKDNADYIKTGEEIIQSYSSKYGYEYYAMSEGIPAKQLGESVYTAAVFTMGDGTEYCSGVKVYSAEEYASGQISKESAEENLKTLVKWMVVYGEAAYTFFNS